MALKMFLGFYSQKGLAGNLSLRGSVAVCYSDFVHQGRLSDELDTGMM